MNKLNLLLGVAGTTMIVPFNANGANNENNAPQTKRPNIILLMTDQHRWDALGCAGNNSVLTPNIDKLAQDGNLFTAGYSSTPSSTPARAGLLTGMSPWAHGMLGYGQESQVYEYETPRILNDLGYYTAGIGKMHWYPQNNRRGFQNLLLDESGRVESENFISDYRQWFNTKAAGLNPDETGIGWNDHAGSVYKLDENLHPTYWTGEMAVQTISGYQSVKPLYLKVSFARPHSPYDPPQRLLDKCADLPKPAKATIGDWEPESWKKNTNPESNLSAAVGNFSEEYVENSRIHYNASVAFIDEQIGRIIEELKKKGMYENSLIFFVADHGDMLGDHYLWRKTYAYEGSAAIPFIVKMPESVNSVIPKGKTVDAPVELRDVLPTMLAVNNCEQPEKMDGMSMLELYTKKNPTWRKYIDIEHATAYFKENYWCSLTDGKIKYIWFMNTGEEQLFDLEKDPYENKNLTSVKSYAKELKEMREAMVEHLSVRGEDWVKDGKLVMRDKVMLYSPNFPSKKQKDIFVK